MCRSVPQIEAARTRTRTSAGPTVGIFAVSNERPRAGCIFRKAFIVVGMLETTWQALIQARNYNASTAPPSTLQVLGLFSIHVSDTATGVQLPPAISPRKRSFQPAAEVLWRCFFLDWEYL